MGCQVSKATATSASPAKTLLPNSEASKTKLTGESHESRVGETGPVAPTGKGGDTNLAKAAQCHGDFNNTSQCRGALRRELTFCTDRTELDILVTEFTSHDSTVGSAIGRNCKEICWKVGYDRRTDPIDIKLHVQENKVYSHEVHIESNGQSIFQGANSHAKAKMVEDFTYQWPFRATIRGINEVNYFEVRPVHLSADTWHPATITCQRSDGFFEVTALEPNGRGGFAEVKYPAVDRSNLRDAATHKPLLVPQNFLMLQVLKQDPTHAVLSVGDEPINQHLGRMSPPVTNTEQALQFQVSKDRGTVTANVGHSVLSHFVSGEVRSVTTAVERLRHSWTFKLGPHAEHIVEVTKKYTLGKIVTLLVDGTVLAEATATELGCSAKSDEWQCSFRFIGERVLDFEVFKTNKDGSPLDQKDHVKERRRYVHECTVAIPNDWDFRSATLMIDGKYFNELPVQSMAHEEQVLSMEPRALMHTYGITTPYKVDVNAPSNFAALASNVFPQAKIGAAKGLFGFCCCGDAAVKDDSMLVEVVVEPEPVLSN